MKTHTKVALFIGALIALAAVTQATTTPQATIQPANTTVHNAQGGFVTQPQTTNAATSRAGTVTAPTSAPNGTPIGTLTA
jgi:hypothetical protein